MPSNEEKFVARALDAFEAAASEWKLRKVSNYGLADDTYVVERSPSGPCSRGDGTAPVDDVAAVRFDGPEANQRARLFQREKILRAVLRAVGIKVDE
jgi:hypothetical protein